MNARRWGTSESRAREYDDCVRGKRKFSRLVWRLASYRLITELSSGNFHCRYVYINTWRLQGKNSKANILNLVEELKQSEAKVPPREDFSNLVYILLDFLLRHDFPISKYHLHWLPRVYRMQLLLNLFLTELLCISLFA